MRDECLLGLLFKWSLDLIARPLHLQQAVLRLIAGGLRLIAGGLRLIAGGLRLIAGVLRLIAGVLRLNVVVASRGSGPTTRPSATSACSIWLIRAFDARRSLSASTGISSQSLVCERDVPLLLCHIR